MTDPFANLPKDQLRALSRDPSRALDLGKAAEHLVCADLILQGYRCYLSDQGLPYDAVVDVDGRLVRLQVKAVCFPRNMNAQGRAPRTGYTFYVARRGKSGRKRLSGEHCEIVALVALDIRIVAYLPVRETATTCQLMPPGYTFPGKFKRSRILAIDALPFSEALSRCK